MARTRNGSTRRQRVARYLPLRYNKLSCRCLSSLSPKGLVTWNRVPMCFTSTISKKGDPLLLLHKAKLLFVCFSSFIYSQLFLFELPADEFLASEPGFTRNKKPQYLACLHSWPSFLVPKNAIIIHNNMLLLTPLDCQHQSLRTFSPLKSEVIE